MGARLRLPPSSFPGPWVTPLSIPPHSSPQLALGTCSSFLHPSWPGRVPEAHSLSCSCHFSSASLFLLSASYTPQRLHRKAWLLLRPRLKPMDRTQVSWWQVCLPSWVPQACPRACNGGTWQTTGLLGGDLGSRCLGGRTGDSEPTPPPTSSCHVWSLRQPRQVTASRPMPCTVRIPRLFPSV